MLASFDGSDPFEELTPAEVSSQTYARLYDEASLPNLDEYPHSQFAPGVVEMLALDLPNTVAVYFRKHADKFGGWEALRRQGLTSLRALEHEHLETVPTQGAARSPRYWGTLSTQPARRCCCLDSPRNSLGSNHTRAWVG